MYKPYIYWTREEFKVHFLKQLEDFGQQHMKQEVLDSVYDKRWIPSLDFDGCTVVQDIHHPCLACWFHDHAWVMKEQGFKSEIEFYKNLVNFGMPVWKALIMATVTTLVKLITFKWLDRR